VRELVKLAWLVALAACGDNAAPEPRPLVADPAVEVGCTPLAPGHARAKVIACADELVAGRLAGGRIGDFLIENDRIRVVVRGPGEGWYLQGSWGGGIIDAAPVGGEDLVKEIDPSIDFAVGAFDELVITEAGDDGPAELVVRGPATGLDLIRAALGRDPPAVIIEHHYRLDAGATALELETRVFPAAGATLDAPQLYDVVSFGGRVHVFQPGQNLFVTDGTTSSYGLIYPGDAPGARLIDLGGTQLLSGPTLDREPQRRYLVIGDGSVASVTETAWKLLATPLGAVTGTAPAGADIVIADADGTPVTVARAGADGTFRAAVPPGERVLHAEMTGHLPGPVTSVTVGTGRAASAVVGAGAAGMLAISVRDDDTSAPMPARVVIEQGGDRRIEWIGASGDVTLAVPPGTVRVSISRGLEYDAFVAGAITVADGQTVPVAARLSRVIDTSGWISVDTHLHSELSTDSSFPLDDRLRAVAAEGVEVAVSSDHDFVVAYGPAIADLGLDDWLGAMTGEEASSLGWGHLNAWPLVVDPTRAGGGAARWFGYAPSDVFTALRAGDAHRIVQCNHPRYGTTSLFDAIDLDPSTLTARRDPAELGLPPTTDLSDLSFDAVEVANGLADGDFEEVFADYLAMVAAGHPAAATGSSDSHGATAYAGEARTYVWVGVGADDPRTFDPLALNDGLRARHVVVGTGAFVTAGVVTTAGVSLPGDDVDVTGAAQVALHIRVQAPPWQPLAKITIFEGGSHAIDTIMLDPADTAAVRYDADVSVAAPVSRTFWVVRVDPAGAGDPVLAHPMPAFTNPIFAHVQ
jgi:hypothetical protein